MLECPSFYNVYLFTTLFLRALERELRRTNICLKTGDKTFFDRYASISYSKLLFRPKLHFLKLQVLGRIQQAAVKSIENSEFFSGS